MKRTRNAAVLFQFVSLSFWVIATVTSGVLYRMLVSAMFFEFPIMILICQTVALLAGIQLTKTLLPDLCKSWNTSLDPNALPASILLSITIFMDYCFLLETGSSRFLQLLISPVVAFIVLNSSGCQRTKIGRKFPVVMSILSVVFSFNSLNVSDLTSDGLLFGAALLLFNVASLMTLRRYLKDNSVSRFLFSHCTLVSAVLFLYEIYKASIVFSRHTVRLRNFQHDIHRLYLYVQVWQLPYFCPVFFSFLVSSLLSLLSFCHVVTRFDLTTIAICLNTKCSWQFLIANFVFRNIAMKTFFEVDFTNYVSAIATCLLNVAVFWMDSKKRADHDIHLRNVE